MTFVAEFQRGLVHPSPARRLIVDLLDGASGLYLWRGTATRVTAGKPEGSAKLINRAARKMFKDFPPG